jgi:hypothetical protein
MYFIEGNVAQNVNKQKKKMVKLILAFGSQNCINLLLLTKFRQGQFDQF